MALVRKIPPASEPVTLGEAKSHVRVDTADDDALINGLIRAAREYCEDFQGRSYLEQTWQLWLDAWPEGNEIILPRPPLKSVTHVKYYGADGTEYTLPATDYIVDTVSEPGRIVLGYGKTWPSITLRLANAIVVEYVAGRAAVGEVPQRVKQAMQLLVGHWYEHREAVLTGSISKEIELSVHALLWPDRVVPA